MRTDDDENAFSPDGFEPRHQLTRSRLADGVTAEALGQPGALADPEIAGHLARCTACQEELDELRALVGAAYGGAIEPAAAYPATDLSFLPRRTIPHATPPTVWQIDAFGRLVITFSQALLDALRQPSLAGARRGQRLYMYALDAEAVPDLRVAIDIFAEEGDRSRGLIHVSVEDQTRDPLDQLGTAIVVRIDDDVREATTDDTGSAAFRSVPIDALPRLRVEIGRKADRSAE